MGTNLQLFVPKFYFLYKMGTKTALSVPKGQFQGATGTEYGSPIVLCRKLAIFQPAGQSVGFRRAGVCRCIILRQQVSDNQWLYSCEGGENHPPSLEGTC